MSCTVFIVHLARHTCCSLGRGCNHPGFAWTVWTRKQTTSGPQKGDWLSSCINRFYPRRRAGSSPHSPDCIAHFSSFMIPACDFWILSVANFIQSYQPQGITHLLPREATRAVRKPFTSYTHSHASRSRPPANGTSMNNQDNDCQTDVSVDVISSIFPVFTRNNGSAN